MTTSTSLRQLDFGEIYATSFGLMRRTGGVALLALLLIIGGGYLFSTATVQLFSVLADAATKGMFVPHPSPDVAKDVGPELFAGFIRWLLVGIVFFMLFLFGQVAITLASWEALNNRPVHLGEILSLSIRRPFWVTLLQTIIIVVIIAVAVMVLSVAFGLATGGGAAAQAGQVFGWVLNLLMLYPIIMTILRVPKIAVEARGPWKGIIASIALVKSNFWRTTGIIVLGLIGTGALVYIVNLATGTQGTMTFGGPGQDPDAIIAMYDRLKNIAPPLTLLTWAVSGFAMMFVLSYLPMSLYVDLRARSGEFTTEGEDDELMKME